MMHNVHNSYCPEVDQHSAPKALHTKWENETWGLSLQIASKKTDRSVENL